MEPTFELFDHTADMGVRVRASTMPGLIAPASEGFYATIGEVAVGEGATPFLFEARGAEASVLLRDYLAELLLRFERDHEKIVGPFDVRLDEDALRVAASAGPIDVERSEFFREVKAVTYHELFIRPIDGGFVATFIVDI